MPQAFAIDWTTGTETERGECLVCRYSGDGTLVATRRADDGALLRVWRCPGCGSAAITGGAGDREQTAQQLRDYLTSSGGLDQIIQNLYRVDHSTTRSLLDVGCYLGFGVHYATSMLGWRGVGIEPSRAGRWGAEHLGVEVLHELLDESTELGETFDLVVASEVIEHVPDPEAFLRALGRMLAPGGAVVLTTPDVEVLGPHDVNGSMQIVGMGEHRLLASRDGLRRLLERAGFAGVAISRTGLSHVVVAAREPDRHLDTEPRGPGHEELARYYRSVAALVDDRGFAFAMLGRAFALAVASGDWGNADAIEAEYTAFAAELHGVDLTRPESFATADADLETFLIRFSHDAGMSRLARGLDDRLAARYLDASAVLADRRLRRLGWLDAGSEMLREHAARQRSIAFGRLGSAPGRLGSMGADGTPDAARWAVRTFVELASAGDLSRFPEIAERAAAVLGETASDDPELFLRAVAAMAERGFAVGDGWTAETWAALGLDHLREVLAEAPGERSSEREGLLALQRRARELPAGFGRIRSPQPGEGAEAALWGAASREFVDGAVSVVVALHNGARYIERALRSIAAQARPALEIVVVDDGSTDGAAETLASLDLGVPIEVVHRENGGQSAARNTGIRRARGEFVAFLDQDDEWRAEHLERLVPALEADPECAWAFADFDVVDAAGGVLIRDYLTVAGTPHPRNTIGALVQRDVMVLPSASLIRRSVLLDCGGFDRRLIGYEDDDLFVRVFRAGWTCSRVQRSTVRYRVHGDGASWSGAFLRSRLLYLQKLLAALPEGTQRELLPGAFVFPRFLGQTLAEYSRALSVRDYARTTGPATAARTLLGLLGPMPLRIRLGLHLMDRPRRMRMLLATVGRLPRFLRPRIPASLRLSQTSAVGAEREYLLSRR